MRAIIMTDINESITYICFQAQCEGETCCDVDRWSLEYIKQVAGRDASLERDSRLLSGRSALTEPGRIRHRDRLQQPFTRPYADRQTAWTPISDVPPGG